MSAARVRLARWLGWALLAGLAAAFAVAVDWPPALAAAVAADPLWLLLAVAINGALLPLAALQWGLLLPADARLSGRRLFDIIALTSSVANGAPILAGQAAGAHLLATRGGLGHARAVSVTVLEQLTEGMAKLALLATAALVVPRFDPTAGLLVLLAVPALTVALALAAHRREWADALPERVPRLLVPAARCFALALAHLDALRRPSRFGGAIAIGALKKAVEGVAIAVVAAALGVPLPIWAIVAAVAAVNLSQLVAVTPANLGPYEAGAFVVFRAAGVAPETALALALVQHAAYLLPLAGTGWLIESARLLKRPPLAPSERGLLALIALLGLAVHGWFVLGADALDTDRSIVLLMARRFAQGELSIYFWQQNYMGALEPFLLAPLAALGWATPTAAALVGVAITAALAALSVVLARRLGGLAWLALLFWAVPPALVVHHHVALYGARLLATLLSLGAVMLTLRARTRGAWLAAGALAGVAYFGDHLMIAWAIGAMWVAARRGALPRFALGALPIVALDTAAAVLTPAVHLAGPNDPSGWLANVPLLFGTTLPQLFGLLLGRGPGPLFEPALPLVPTGWIWVACAVPGAAALLALLGTLARGRRDASAPNAPVDTERALALEALLLACVASLGLFALVGGGGDRWPARYLVPLWPAISVGAAVAAARWRPTRRALAAAAALPAVFTLFADHTWPRAADAAPARAEAAAVGDAVARSGARAVWADYWDTYRMALLAGETPPWVTLRIIQRRPEQASAAERAEPVAYLLRGGDREVGDSIASAAARGEVRVRSTSEVGRYRLVITDRSVPGLVLITSHPTRAWQRLAALGAGLLFGGTLLGVGLLARWRAAAPPLATSGSRAAAEPDRSAAGSPRT